MEFILQKFGGTSLQTKQSRINCIDKIKKELLDGNRIVVVVSAMGRKESSYSTDSLLSLVSDKFKLKNLELSDKLVSCGEVISAVVFSSELQEHNINAYPLTGQDIGILTDDNFGNAKILDIDISNIKKLLDKNIVPVIAGFQGVTNKGSITTLGRGGSDISAIKLASALGCDKVDFYKDVNGLMTADPKLVENAQSIEQISYEELFELSVYGNNVIHPQAVKLAMDENMPIFIKNTFNNFKGTKINRDKANKEQLFKGITYLKNCIQIKIFKEDNSDNENYFRVFQTLSEKNINVDFINIFLDHKIFTVKSYDFELIENIMIDFGLKYSVVQSCSKIGLIKSDIKNVSILMAELIEFLYKQNIEVLQTNHSNISIWFLIKNINLQDSLNILHNNFLV